MTDWLSEEESWDLLSQIFPEGLGGADVMESLCPEGWRNSPLRLAIHPSPEQRYEELVHMRKNLEWLQAMNEERRRRMPSEQGGTGAGEDLRSAPLPLDPLPKRETFLAETRDREEEPPDSDGAELGRLVGLCLWDVLSDNHDLILSDGQVRHLGSFRAAAGIIADFFCGKAPLREKDTFGHAEMTFDMGYCEFYMGTSLIAGRTDLGSIYRLIFKRLQALDCAWQYSFPKLGVVRFARQENAGKAGAAEWEGYDPSAAIAREEEEHRKEAEFRRLQQELERIHAESLEAAKRLPPPDTVLAYEQVFGHWPSGWPPWEE